MDDVIALPKRILLATDLSHRSDRALDRAAQLAEQWQVALLAATALENEPSRALPHREPPWDERREVMEAHAQAARTLRHDLEGFGLEPLIRVGRGDPADFVLSLLEPGDLIVSGIARSRFLDAITLGSTTERLVRRAAAPVLVVRQRARHAYRSVVVACDFSPTSARALRSALTAFPDAACTLFHAVLPPLGGLVDGESTRQDLVRAARDEADAFLDALALREPDRARLRVEAEYGAIDACLHGHIRDGGGDLVVVGTHGRSALFDILIGSTARRVLETVESDVLVIPEPRARN